MVLSFAPWSKVQWGELHVRRAWVCFPPLYPESNSQSIVGTQLILTSEPSFYLWGSHSVTWPSSHGPELTGLRKRLQAPCCSWAPGQSPIRTTPIPKIFREVREGRGAFGGSCRCHWVRESPLPLGTSRQVKMEKAWGVSGKAEAWSQTLDLSLHLSGPPCPLL